MYFLIHLNAQLKMAIVDGSTRLPDELEKIRRAEQGGGQ
jgi:hypothetical protein